MKYQIEFRRMILGFIPISFRISVFLFLDFKSIISLRMINLEYNIRYLNCLFKIECLTIIDIKESIRFNCSTVYTI